MNTTKQKRLTDVEIKLVVTHVEREAERGRVGVGDLQATRYKKATKLDSLFISRGYSTRNMPSVL